MAVDPRWQQLQAAFGAELEERVRALTELLLRLERDEEGAGARRALLDALFREAHNLKGAAQAVDLRQIEEVAHTLESTLEAVRRDEVSPPAPWFDAAYRSIDALGTLYQETLGADGAPADPPRSREPLHGDQPATVAAGPPLHPATTVVQREPVQLPTMPPHGEPSHTPSQAGGPPASLEATRTLSAPEHPQHPPQDAAAKARGPMGAESVRVAVTKLDALLAQAGELRVTHGRVTRRLGELRAVQQDLEAWRRAWRGSRTLRASLHRRSGEDDTSAPAMAGDVQALLRFADGAEQRLQAVLQSVTVLAGQLRDDALTLGLITRSIEDEVMGMRLLPLTTIFGPLERLARDVARDTGKDARLTLHGGEMEIDRKILDGLRDPLMHMVRNAVDHGVETPAERQAQGKQGAGTIVLSAAGRGGAIEIVLEDDGAGLDPAMLRATAAAKGLLSEAQAALLTDSAAWALIFEAGFSTRTIITETSGRGVGMDVVRENVRRLGGHLTVSSVLGHGTRFTLNVPLTLVTTRVILLEQSDQLFGLPSLLVERTARARDAHLTRIEGSRAVLIDGVAVPIVALADVLEQRGVSMPDAPTPLAWQPYVVLRHGERRVALLVEQLVGEQEIVVKSLGWPLRAVRNVAGAAVLGSGHTVLILDTSDLLTTGLKLIAAGAAAPQEAATGSAVTQRQRRVLVVDDSLTTRTLETSILEAAGYAVVATADGVEALEALRSQVIDLVISDVEMPRLDGFGLTTEIRRDDRLRQIPVILVTSLEARESRARGADAGADAYVLKSQFDQGDLLDTVSRLL